MLNSLFPVALVAAPVVPIHLAIAMPHIVEVIAFVGVAARPSKYSVAALLIVCVFTLILVGFAWSSLPNTVSVPQAVLEVAFKEASVRPIIFAVARRLAIYVTADVYVSVCELLSTLPML